MTLPPLRGARREFEVHVTEPPSAQPDAAGWAGTVRMGGRIQRSQTVNAYAVEQRC